MRRETLLLPLLFTFVACRPAASTGPRTKLVVEGSPATAAVLVDEQPLGTLAMVARRGVALPPGQHRLTVQADGYFPADVLVEIGRGGGVQRQVVRLTTLPEP